MARFDVSRFIPEKYRFWKRDNKGNLLVGNNTVVTEGGTLTGNTIVGKNTIRTRVNSGEGVSISGNRVFGRNKIIIHTSGEEEMPEGDE